MSMSHSVPAVPLVSSGDLLSGDLLSGDLLSGDLLSGDLLSGDLLRNKKPLTSATSGDGVSTGAVRHDLLRRPLDY